MLLANVPLDGGAVTSGRLSGDPATDPDTLLALSDLLDGVPGFRAAPPMSGGRRRPLVRRHPG